MTLLESFDIGPVAGKTMRGRLYQSPHRRTGRRITVNDGDTLLFDTGDAYDIGNAQNALDRWLESYVLQTA